MNIEKEFIIPKDKIKISILVLGLVIAIPISAFLIEASFEIAWRNWNIFALGALILCSYGLLMLILNLLILLNKLFDKSPGLIISPDGILDNPGVLSASVISWRNISKVDSAPYYYRGFNLRKGPTIEVTNSELYYKNGILLSRILKRLQNPFYKNKIYLSNATLKISSDELSKIIKRYYERYGHA